jgi:hypothetical protein
VPGSSGYYPTWRQATFDLSGYSGAAKIRFRFGSDQGTTAEGWYIDDVVITAGAYGPDIDLDPWAFEVTLSAGDSTSVPLTIMNVGGAQLDFTIDVNADSALVANARIVGSKLRSDWLSVVPSSGAVDPDMDAAVDVVLNASGLMDGTYYGTLTVNSNDPDETWLLVPVELEVASAVCGDANGDEQVTSGDGYMILNYFGSGPVPASCWAANVNGDSGVTPGDGYSLLNYLGGGPALDCAPCDFSASSGEPLLRIETKERSRSN